MIFQKVCVIGVGLIGGSLALELKHHQLARQIIGVDNHIENLSYALEHGIVDVATSSLTEEVLSADIVVMATPVTAMEKLMPMLAGKVAPHTIITDVGSTKQATVTAFEAMLPEYYPRYVPAHPIAGSEQSGSMSARLGLFLGKKLIICPHQQQDQHSLEVITKMWQHIGMQVFTMTAQEHDYIFAGVSHLPHILSYAYMHQIIHDKHREQLLKFAGTGFRDFTRIAASHPDMWADICLANRESLLSLIERQKAELDWLHQQIEQKNHSALRSFFHDVKIIREEWQ